MLLRKILAAFCLIMAPVGVIAQANVFERGWTLEPSTSSLQFQSVKNLTVVESSGFATFSGTIDESGAAKISVMLDSVDTKVDLRNVRMRFLFFETFQFPEATVTATIDPAELADLAQVRRKIVNLTYTLDLHGFTKTSDAEVAVTLISDDLVAISSTTPISVATADFGLDDGVKKLEEAASVRIVPSATVSFDFVFQRNSGNTAPMVTAAANPANAALETEGNFDLEACKGRFEILSRTDNIYFGSGSARLDPKSAPLLDSLSEIISRCPGLVIEVSGHTDTDGSANLNQRLSEKRAGSVIGYLVTNGIQSDRLRSVGHGESRPVASNATAQGKARNRRIEFRVVDG